MLGGFGKGHVQTDQLWQPSGIQIYYYLAESPAHSLTYNSMFGLLAAASYPVVMDRPMSSTIQVTNLAMQLGEWPSDTN